MAISGGSYLEHEIISHTTVSKHKTPIVMSLIGAAPENDHLTVKRAPLLVLQAQQGRPI